MERSTAVRWLVILTAGSIGLGLLALSSVVCLGGWISHGIRVRHCPDGRPRQTVGIEAYDVRRGRWSDVTVVGTAHYTSGPVDGAETAIVRRGTAKLELLGKDGAPLAVKLEPKGSSRGRHRFRIELPADLADGDYTLAATLDSPLGVSTHRATLGLYAAAKIHVLTDRPLYEPGNLVQFRALVLRANDLAPLEGRPGRFVIRDPSGESVLEERSPTGDFGVTAGNFPLDADAPAGAWTVRYESGDAVGEASIRVEPFLLPRFRIEAEASRGAYGPGDVPKITGRVVYSSGAPVSGAAIDVEWSAGGAWPMPTAWLERELLRRVTADARGYFELPIPRVPGDLRGRVPLTASLRATDPAGDVVNGAATALLSEHPIRAEVVTELQGGLVEGFNNRMYVRVTTADDRVLAGAKLRVKRAWEPQDPGIEAETDADGAAALQIDPGPPVNVVIPPMPVRPPPPRRAISVSLAALDGDSEPRIEDQTRVEALGLELERCARFVRDAETVSLFVELGPDGATRHVGHARGALARCLAAVARSSRWPALGAPRIYVLEVNAEPADLPRFEVEIGGGPDPSEAMVARIEEAVMDARACLPSAVESGRLGRAFVFRASAGQKQLAVSAVPEAGDDRPVVSAEVQACVASRVATIPLDEPVPHPMLGLVELTVVEADRVSAIRPQATTMIGYELEVSATTKDGERLGKTQVYLQPGTVPPVRLRPSSVLPKPGEVVTVQIIRGPSFSGTLPKKLHLVGEKHTIDAEVDAETKRAGFKLPPDARGWYEVAFGGARALLFVRSEAELEVALATDRDRYQPGDTAKLSIQTKLGGAGAPAAVGLVGVDESLAQLAPLPGPDALAGLRPQVVTPEPAFGVLDGQALSLGRIRGENAAQAVVLRVTQIPARDEGERSAMVNSSGTFSPLEDLVDRFYVALGELYAVTRAWEASAPPGEQMKPERMARLWKDALERLRARGQAVEDAYGRPLALRRLPDDLLALTAPQAVIMNGTRLPEDVEDWNQWVRRNRP